MKELSLTEVQQIELKLLLQADRVCREHGWRYSLCGGSLIGAVRHHGFIPWDDDIDIFLPRPDFDQFLTYCKQAELPFRLTSHDTAEAYNNLFAKLWDPSTCIVDKVAAEDGEIGVSIDVFPIEGLGNSMPEAQKTFSRTEWTRELLNAAGWKKYARSTTHSWLLEPVRLVLFIISRFVDPKKLLKKVERINRSHPFDECLYAGDVAGSYRRREIMEKAVFDGWIDAEFEGHTVRILEHYHDFLTNIYGDYMTLPPENKRVTHHTYTAYLK